MKLKSEVYLPSDYIVHKGAPGNEMYLISRGICEVTVTDMKSIAEQREEEKAKAANAKRKGRRRSSTSDVLSGAMNNFTDFIQARNAKMAQEKEDMLKQPETEDGLIPKQRKSYVKNPSQGLAHMRKLSMPANPMRRVSASLKVGKGSSPTSPQGGRKLSGVSEDGGEPNMANMTPEEREDFIKGAKIVKKNSFQGKRAVVDPLKSQIIHHEKVVKELVEGEYVAKPASEARKPSNTQ